MKPEYLDGLWLEIISAEDAVYYLPARCFIHVPGEMELAPYADVELKRDQAHEPISLYTVVRGTGARLSAPGSMSATGWFVLADEKHAREHVKTTWRVDPDTGEDLEGKTMLSGSSRHEVHAREAYAWFRTFMITDDLSAERPDEGAVKLAEAWAMIIGDAQVESFARSMRHRSERERSEAAAATREE